MKTVILGGGKGSRMGEATGQLPKPLIEIGGKPVRWHIMKIYASQGFNEFVLCLGYKGEKIKEYFSRNNGEKWKIDFVDTGESALKSERVEKMEKKMYRDKFFSSYWGEP